jgi:hypothetical protein
MLRLEPKSGKHHSRHGDRYGKKETDGFNAKFKTEVGGKQVRKEKVAGLDVNSHEPKIHTLNEPLLSSGKKKGRPTFRKKTQQGEFLNLGMSSGGVSSKIVSPLALGKSTEKVLHPPFSIKKNAQEDEGKTVSPGI